MKKKILGIFSVGAIALSPVIATSCSASLKHVNLLANYDNALDASFMLGVAPQHYLSNFMKHGKQFAYAPYLEPYIDSKKTQVHDIRIYDGEDTDLKTLSRLEPYTFLVNEWEKQDAAQYKDVVTHMAYTSMGDSVKARWDSDPDCKKPSYCGHAPGEQDQEDKQMQSYYKWLKHTSGSLTPNKPHKFALHDGGVSPQKALKLAAVDLDRIYQTNGIFEKRANEINDKFKTIVKTWNKSDEFKKFLRSSVSEGQNPFSSNYKSSLNYITSETNETWSNNVKLGIILGGNEDNTKDFRFLSPNSLPLFYSGVNDRGLGFSFPLPWQESFMNDSNYIDTYIRNKANPEELLKQFKGKFDYLIYVQSINTEATNKSPNLNDFASLLKPGRAVKHIYQTTYFNVYDPIWGMMGYTHLLDILANEIITEFSNGINNFSLETFKSEVQATKINIPDKNKLVNIKPDTDFTKFPEHTY